ncbi:polysaccharide deacetylase family protein [Wenzhouxiangella sp. 15181]|uniref:polysaccharide deacetylase family protein n=1 Tax=Wenzhouxiangella sp. 15181 TaxID=2301224 RepID=UPI0021633B37|nr:polysaccharide deacetylase family protein [Wenzhouxiangella sp. 15181]
MRPDISIHDVMPETLDRVAEQLDLIERHCPGPVTLLVVPGKEWTDSDLDRLRAWAADGHPLAGHGWTHRARHIRGLKHRLHSLFISRDCAEHLALSPSEIVDLMTRNRQWFTDHHLPAPELYVPPAWALGPVSATELRPTGFERVETISGHLDLATGRFQRSALIGFEAASAWQMPALKISNALNRLLAVRWPLRIALHPNDHRLPLAADLHRWLIRSASFND